MQVINDNWAQELVDCIHFLHQKGFAPATSNNYSFRKKGEEVITISSSGKDKGLFAEADLMKVDLNGKAINDERRPSAETLLHTMIYAHQAEVCCVLHTHTVFNTVLSSIFEDEGNIRLEGFEVLKGLSGIKTHDTFVDIPVFSNSQDMESLSDEILRYWERHPDMRAFLLAGHGLYTWGKDIASTKRHIEVLEFLFECYYRIHIFKK